MPDINDIIELINQVKQQDFDNGGGYIELTVATDGTDWVYQLGDNSFHGPCYGMPHWAVQWVDQCSDPQELAQDLLFQLEELTR